MVVDDDTALILGRELLGFPKKMADIELEVDGVSSTCAYHNAQQPAGATRGISADLGYPNSPRKHHGTTYSCVESELTQSHVEELRGEIGDSPVRLATPVPRTTVSRRASSVWSQAWSQTTVNDG